MIHLRSENDVSGDLVDLHWFCSEQCWQDSFEIPHEGHWEVGGAYPCGAESDSPDFCTTCGRPVGNPLTDEGITLVRTWMQDQPFTADPTGENRARLEELRRVYGDRPRYAVLG